MALDVKVKIDMSKPIGSAGFGIPLILEEGTANEHAYTECRSLADVVTAGYAATSKVYKAANAIFMQNNAPEKIAVCGTDGTAKNWLADVSNTGKDWRQLIVVSGSETEVAVADIMAAVETLENKLYFADVDVEDSTSYTTSGINRTVLFYCAATAEYPSPVAALVGATAGLAAGSFTYKNLILKGIAAQSLTEAQIDAIHAKGGITFVTKAGDNVTSEGKVAGGEYIDIIDCQDYVVSNLQYQIQKTLNSADKLPMDNTGIAVLESVAVGVLRDCYNNGIIATNDDNTAAYSVNFATREQTDEADRVVRKYVGGQFSFKLAGAIHTVEITGEIEI